MALKSPRNLSSFAAREQTKVTLIRHKAGEREIKIKMQSKDIVMKNMKAKWNCEPSLQQLLADPIVNTLMAADRVDPDELRDELREKARDFPRKGMASRSKGFFGFAECCG